MKTTAERLLVKPGARIVIMSPGWDGAALVGSLPDAATIVHAGEPADVVIAFVSNEAELRASLPAAAAAASGDRLLWLAYPKLSSGMATNLSRDVITPLTDELSGLTGVAIVAIDSTWSAMRLRPSARYR
jgi:hypothetical protein